MAGATAVSGPSCWEAKGGGYQRVKGQESSRRLLGFGRLLEVWLRRQLDQAANTCEREPQRMDGGHDVQLTDSSDS